ncbi:MAG: GNAT family N-acetyltransferase [Candidatus Roizmanbacteria bacterium]|nr:MAG: GNAT family N-acetyltransferase [Candidatus Roizmanbacteria bacterium]
MKMLRFSETLSKLWDSFIMESNNGTIFQMRRFLSYHPNNRFKDCSLLFLEDDKLIAVMPAVLKKEGKNLIFASHPGATYGGIVHKKVLSLQNTCKLVEELIKYVTRLGCEKMQITPPPILYHKLPSNNIEFAFHKNGFYLKKRELTSIVSLKLETNISNIFKQEARTALRKAVKKKIKTKNSDDFITFYNLLKVNLMKKYNVNPTHSLEELLKLKELFPDKISLKSAYLNEKLIAGVINFVCNEKVMLAFYISQDNDYQSYRPLNLLFHEILNECRQKGYYFYDLGLFTVNMEPNWGLARFKESLGGNNIFRDYYERRLSKQRLKI